MTRTQLTVLALLEEAGDSLLLQRHLDNIADWQVELLVRETTTDALSTLASGLIDVVFLADGAQCENGVSTVRTIRRAGHRVPVVFLTDRADPAAQKAAREAGAADHIAKGRMSPNSLRRLIENAVERARLDYLVREHRHDIRRMQDGIAERNREITRLSRLLTHDLRSSLATIRDFVSIVLDGVAGPLTNAQREHLGLALRSCDDITRDIDQIVTPELVEAVRSIGSTPADEPDGTPART
jgi:CheY-like chemotaxis protein